MILIDNNHICLSAGDDAVIEVSISLDGEPYTLESGDVLTFSASCGLKKQSTDGKFIFEAKDTANLSPGTYKWDLRLTYANGTTTAITLPAPFELMEVVS